MNGKKVNIPSYVVKINDVIELLDRSRSSEKFKILIENRKSNSAMD